MNLFNSRNEMEKMSIFPTFKCAAAINFHHVQMLKINGGGGGIKVVENYSDTNAQHYIRPY